MKTINWKLSDLENRKKVLQEKDYLNFRIRDLWNILEKRAMWNCRRLYLIRYLYVQTQINCEKEAYDKFTRLCDIEKIHNFIDNQMNYYKFYCCEKRYHYELRYVLIEEKRINQFIKKYKIRIDNIHLV